MSETYTFFIDESGDSGIKKLRSESEGGASPYMTLGGVLVRNSDATLLIKHLSNITDELQVPSLHCANMSHHRKVTYIKRMVGQPILCLGVISYKPTLGEYKDEIGNEYWRYYHKCAQYLLERLGLFIKYKNISKENVKIVFEASNHLKLESFKKFIAKCQQNPKKSITACLKCLEASNIVTATKDENQLLQLADLVAHVQYQCVNKSKANYGITECRYLFEMRSLFLASPKTNKILDIGIVPAHYMHKWDLDDDVRQFLKTLTIN